MIISREQGREGGREGSKRKKSSWEEKNGKGVRRERTLDHSEFKGGLIYLADLWGEELPLGGDEVTRHGLSFKVFAVFIDKYKRN